MDDAERVVECDGLWQLLSEFDCMREHYAGGNRETGNQKFENHWRDWINPTTVQSVHDVGLNTIRIPIGYWSLHSYCRYGQ